jgi:hypothetical protein
MPWEAPVGGVALSRGVWLVLLTTVGITGRRDPVASTEGCALNRNHPTRMRVVGWMRAGGWRSTGAARGPPVANYAQWRNLPTRHRDSE